MDLNKLGFEAAQKLYNIINKSEGTPDKRELKTTQKSDTDGTEKKKAPKKIDFTKGAETLKSIQHKKLIIGGIAAVAVIAIALTGVKSYLNSRPVKVYLSSVVEFSEPEGMNGSGTITYEVSRSKLRAAMFGAPVQADPSNQEEMDRVAIYESNIQSILDMAMENIVLVADKDQNLSNGDMVSVEARFQTEGKESFKHFIFVDGVSQYTVQGLNDGSLIQPFANVELNISGINGYATAELNIKKKEMFTYYLNYDYAPKTGLSNGDVVTVSITPDRGKLEELGYAVPTETTKEYKVSGLSRTVESSGEISDLVLNEMYQSAERMLKEEFNAVQIDDNDLVVATPAMSTMYFLDKSDKRTPYTDWFTGLNMVNGIVVTGSYGIDSVTESRNPEEEPTITRMGGYYAFIFPNIMIDPDGTCTYDKTAMVEKVFNFTDESELYTWMTGEFQDFAIEVMGRI